MRDIRKMSQAKTQAKKHAQRKISSNVLEQQGHSGAERAYDALIRAIKSGEILPGDRIREEEVATDLGLSRTPVREALRRLEADGIIEHRPRSGAIIRELSHTEVVELYEMRVVLERTAAGLAAQHGVTAEFDMLQSLNDQISAENSNLRAAAETNRRFHQVLYKAGRNRFLLEAARALDNSLLLLGRTTLTDEDRIDRVVKQHQDIIDALRKRDTSAASEAAETHLQASLHARIQEMEK